MYSFVGRLREFELYYQVKLPTIESKINLVQIHDLDTSVDTSWSSNARMRQSITHLDKCISQVSHEHEIICILRLFVSKKKMLEVAQNYTKFQEFIIILFLLSVSKAFYTLVSNAI